MGKSSTSMAAMPRATTRPGHGMRPGTRILLLAVATVACVGLFMTLGVYGHWDFTLLLRARKIATLALVAYAITVSTVLFQTATGNRILTPAVMGFDALYVLIQSSLVFLLGTQRFLSIDARLLFAVQVLVMVATSALL